MYKNTILKNILITTTFTVYLLLQGGILHGGASRQHPMQPGMLQQQQVPLQTLPFGKL